MRELCERIKEVTNTPVEQMHLFMACDSHPDARAVAALAGFRPSWAWPADARIIPMLQSRTLESYSVQPGQTLYLLCKLGVLASAPHFDEEVRATVTVALAAQKFKGLLLGGSTKKQPSAERRASILAERRASIAERRASSSSSSGPAAAAAAAAAAATAGGGRRRLSSASSSGRGGDGGGGGGPLRRPSFSLANTTDELFVPPV